MSKVNIEPVFEDSINIVFAVDKNYIPYLSVALQSLIENSSDKFNYDICILHSDINDEEIQIFSKLEKANISIRFVNIKKYIIHSIQQKGIVFHTRSYFTISIYYRLYIPLIFKNFNKVLYIDSDIIINEDIANLFHTSLDNHPLGAVKDVAVILACRRLEKSWENDMLESIKKCSINNYLNYFNSGVLIYDINMCNYLNITEKCLNKMKLVNGDLYLPDQDILNSVFQGNVKFLPQKWNFEWTIALSEKDYNLYVPKEIVKEYEESKEKPSLIHYISPTKPWNSPHFTYSNIWWKYARKNDFYGQLLYENLKIGDIKISDSLKDVSIISFDIFDTLLIRPYVKPSDLFKHIDQNFKYEGRFFKERIEAEKNAALYHDKSIFVVKYDEIYKQINKEFFYLKDIEKKLELQTIYANPEMKALFDFLVKIKKKVVLISDMYHSKEFIENILEKNGIIGYDNIYISSDIGKSKHNGGIYDYVVADLGIDKNEILHIGDNYYSDVEMANKNQIEAIYYKAPMVDFFDNYLTFKNFYFLKEEHLTISIIIGVIVKKWLLNGKQDFEDYWESFGYCFGGPLCYGVSKFVYNSAINEKLQEFIFIARDGFVIKKIFNFLQDKFNSNIKTHYVYAPRAINLFLSFDIDNLKNLPWENKLLSILKLCKENIDDFPFVDLNDLEETEMFELLKGNLEKIKIFKETLETNYRRYINSLDISKNKIGVFDIVTCEFSAIKALESVLDNVQFYGNYMLVVPSSNIRNYISFEYVKNKRFFQNSSIGEFLITSPEFPVRFVDNKGKFIRIKNENEYRKINIYKIISKSELDFSLDLLKIYDNFNVDFDSDIIIDWIDSFTENPSERDFHYFSTVSHSGASSHDEYQDILVRKN
ncbi:TPA: HAD-IA family hydrolase, partial [Campylobacter coli]|nr:HAD-IA family hydrolase [Campylobacter coli]